MKLSELPQITFNFCIGLWNRQAGGSIGQETPSKNPSARKRKPTANAAKATPPGEVKQAHKGAGNNIVKGNSFLRVDQKHEGTGDNRVDL